MANPRYECREPTRWRLVSGSGLNGIDHLEVVDRDAVERPELAGSPRQRTLLVRFHEPVTGLLRENVVVEGGVRVTRVSVLWVARADDVPDALVDDGLVTPGERAYFDALPHPDHVLVVRTDVAGDHSPYRLRLVRGATDARPPDGFDGPLSAVEFSFKVECASGLDCRHEETCPPEPRASPPIDYLAKDYASFRRLMLDRMSTVMPEWRDRNPADGLVALVEVVAYAADRLSYRQDAVATEAYLGTARRRASVRRHARLLDYEVHEGTNARAWVAIEVDGSASGALLARRPAAGGPTRFLTRCLADTRLDAGSWEEVATRHGATVFEPLHDVLLHEAHNEIDFHAWGDAECCLPRGATRATLVDSLGSRLLLRAGDVLVLEERVGPSTGLEADADPSRRHAVRLTRVHPEARERVVRGVPVREPRDAVLDPLTKAHVVEVEWHDEDALPFPLVVSSSAEGHRVTRVSVAKGNVVLADHGASVGPEALLPPVAGAGLRYRPRLKLPDVTHSQPYEHARALGEPASASLRQDPRRALAQVRLHEGSATWEPRRDLLQSGPFHRALVVEVEPGAVARLRFGDGVTGRRPASGSKLRATYRVGSGPSGNVSAEAVAHVVTSLTGIVRVRNPLAAVGGTLPESVDEVREHAPHAFRRQERAVTPEDYARVAERHPEVQRAEATLRWTGSWHTVFLAVDRMGGRPVDDEFESRLRGFIERYRLAAHDVEIEPPRFVPLEVAMTVCVAPGYSRSAVRRGLLDAFSNRALPDGGTGFFHPDRFTFGDPVFLSRLLARAMDVPGVAWVDVDDSPGTVNRFQRFGEPSRGEVDAGRIAMGRLEIARLDNDPSTPENGTIEFHLSGGI